MAIELSAEELEMLRGAINYFLTNTTSGSDEDEWRALDRKLRDAVEQKK